MSVDTRGCLNKYVLVQYLFDGPQVEEKPRPHGNSKFSHPYFHTSETAKAHHKDIAEHNTPKAVMQIATDEQGGELEAKGLNKLPRNLQQLKNYRRCEQKNMGMCYTV